MIVIKTGVIETPTGQGHWALVQTKKQIAGRHVWVSGFITSDEPWTEGEEIPQALRPYVRLPKMQGEE